MAGFFVDCAAGLIFGFSIAWAIGGFALMMMYIHKILPNWTGNRVTNILLVLLVFIAFCTLPWKAGSFVLSYLDFDDDGLGLVFGIFPGLCVVGPGLLLVLVKIFRDLSEKWQEFRSRNAPARFRVRKPAPKNTRNSRDAGRMDLPGKWQKFAGRGAPLYSRERFYARKPVPQNTRNSRHPGQTGKRA